MQVFYDPRPIGLTYESVVAHCHDLPKPISLFSARLVVHHQTDPQAVEDFIGVIRRMKADKEGGGRPEEAVLEGEAKAEQDDEGKMRKKRMLGY
jgi:hypothetical protein